MDGDCSVDVESTITDDGSIVSTCFPQPVRFFLLFLASQNHGTSFVYFNSLALRAAAFPTFGSKAIPISFSTVTRDPPFVAMSCSVSTHLSVLPLAYTCPQAPSDMVGISLLINSWFCGTGAHTASPLLLLR